MFELILQVLIFAAGGAAGYGLRVAHKPDRTPKRGPGGRFIKR